MKDKLKSFNKQKKLITVMIKKYCHGNHKSKRGLMCEDCSRLNEYALMRLDKCPFKENKSFCSACKIHCYNNEMRPKIKAVMRYSGPRMLFSHPIWSISHVMTMIEYKKSLRKEGKEKLSQQS